VSPSPVSPGTLYVVATPIGNLEDVTRRAARVFSEVELVVAEDTRHTRKLLTHLGITSASLSSLHAHAPPERIEKVVQRLLEGAACALVSDAGTPVISDPGAKLVRLARERGVPVVSVPGASAVTAAVAVCGLVDGPFCFLGFLPRKGAARRRALAAVAASARAVVLFEAPTRLAATLAELAGAQPDRPVAVCRELTKLHEQTTVGTLCELSAREHAWRGEITLVLGPVEPRAQPMAEAELERRIDAALDRGQSVKSAVAELSEGTTLSRSELYRRVQSARERRR
jgi:16S rRNA (cytidine1402-2'-O)-methyltransferase